MVRISLNHRKKMEPGPGRSSLK